MLHIWNTKTALKTEENGYDSTIFKIKHRALSIMALRALTGTILQKDVILYHDTTFIGNYTIFVKNYLFSFYI